MSRIGKSQLRFEDDRLLRGDGQFSNDLVASEAPPPEALDETVELSLPDDQKSEPAQPIAVSELPTRDDTTLAEPSPSSVSGNLALKESRVPSSWKRGAASAIVGFIVRVG